MIVRGALGNITGSPPLDFRPQGHRNKETTKIAGDLSRLRIDFNVSELHFLPVSVYNLNVMQYC